MSEPSAIPASPRIVSPDARRGLAVALALVALFAAAFAAVLTGGAVNPRAANDQAVYHLPTIEQFSAGMPRPDVRNYLSATSPGYHLAVAAVHRYVSADPTWLRVAGAAFTALLLGVLGYVAGRRFGFATALSLAAPAAASLHVFASGAWLLPDNAAWLTVLLALLLAYGGVTRPRDYVLAAAVLLAAVLVRQTNVWLAAVLACSAALAPPDARAGPDTGDDRRPTLRPSLRNGWPLGVALVVVAALPAVLALAGLFRLWHGLTPPAFQTVHGPLPPGHSGWQHEGPNLAVPAMALAVLGVAGTFFAGFAWPALRAALAGGRGRARAALAAGASAGFLSAVIVPTSWSQADGRFSGLWGVARVLPVIADRSVLIAGLATLGGVVLALWFLTLPRRDRWIWLAAWLCFIAAQTANAMAWQRYYEPFCLMMLTLASARPRGNAPRAAWAPAGPLLLTVLLGAITAWSLRPAG